MQNSYLKVYIDKVIKSCKLINSSSNDKKINENKTNISTFIKDKSKFKELYCWYDNEYHYLTVKDINEKTHLSNNQNSLITKKQSPYKYPGSSCVNIINTPPQVKNSNKQLDVTATKSIEMVKTNDIIDLNESQDSFFNNFNEVTVTCEFIISKNQDDVSYYELSSKLKNDILAIKDYGKDIVIKKCIISPELLIFDEIFLSPELHNLIKSKEYENEEVDEEQADFEDKVALVKKKQNVYSAKKEKKIPKSISHMKIISFMCLIILILLPLIDFIFTQLFH